MHHAKTVVRVTPKFVHGMVVGVVLGVLVVGSLRYATTTYAAGKTNESSYCIVSATSVDGGLGAIKSFTVKDNVATTHFKVTGPKGCSADVSLASWQAPYGSTDFLPLNDQKLLYKKTTSFTPGNYSMSIQTADCDYQIDVVRGSSATAADGSPNYAGGQLVDFLQQHVKACEPPVTPPATNTPKATPTKTSAPISTAAPTTLVNTGPGAVVIIGLLAVASGYVFHMRHLHRKHRRRSSHH